MLKITQLKFTNHYMMKTKKTLRPLLMENCCNLELHKWCYKSLELDSCVVYFDQRLGAGHSKCRSKYFFGNKTVNQCFGANLKNLFFAKFCCKFLAFLAFLHKKCWKWLFWPAFWVRTTQTLVKIYNTLETIKKYLLQLG